ncbi:hypothetical protein BH11PLA1_BH11PLA1_08390 [soil metagenome]
MTSAPAAPDDSSARLRAWSTRLRAAAALTLGANPRLDEDTIARFADEAGSRRASDAWVLRWMMRGDADDSTVLQAPASPPAADAADVRLWRALSPAHFDARAVDDLVALDAQRDAWTPPVVRIDVTARGPSALEVETERQLSALQALWHLARLHQRADWRAHALRAAAWFVENIQPDNATGHAWALAVFVSAGEMCRAAQALESSREHDLYAQTLLHNAQVNFGRPDLLSAWLLLDAARAVDREPAAPR